MLVSGYWQAWKMLHMEKEVECVPDWVKNILPKPNKTTDMFIPTRFYKPMKFNVGASGKVMIKIMVTSQVSGITALEKWKAEIDDQPVQIFTGTETLLPEDFKNSSFWPYAMNMAGIIFFEGATGEHELKAWTDQFTRDRCDSGIAMRVVEIDNIPQVVDIQTRYTENLYGGQSFIWKHNFNMRKGDLLMFMAAGSSTRLNSPDFITPLDPVNDWKHSGRSFEDEMESYKESTFTLAHSEVFPNMQEDLHYGIVPGVTFPLINNLATPTRVTIAQIRDLTYTT